MRLGEPAPFLYFTTVYLPAIHATMVFLQSESMQGSVVIQSLAAGGFIAVLVKMRHLLLCTTQMVDASPHPSNCTSI